MALQPFTWWDPIILPLFSHTHYLCVFTEVITCDHRSPIDQSLCFFFTPAKSLCDYLSLPDQFQRRNYTSMQIQKKRKKERGGLIKTQKAQLDIEVMETCCFWCLSSKRKDDEGKSFSLIISTSKKVYSSSDGDAVGQSQASTFSPQVICEWTWVNSVNADVTEQVGLAC